MQRRHGIRVRYLCFVLASTREHAVAGTRAPAFTVSFRGLCFKGATSPITTEPAARASTVLSLPTRTLGTNIRFRDFSPWQIQGPTPTAARQDALRLCFAIELTTPLSEANAFAVFHHHRPHASSRRQARCVRKGGGGLGHCEAGRGLW